MVSGITEKPKTETINFFDKLLNGFREEDDADPGRTYCNSATNTSIRIRHKMTSLKTLEINKMALTYLTLPV
jgi:hypothetical protein